MTRRRKKETGKPEHEAATDAKRADRKSLRRLLEQDEVAELDDPAVRQRIGETISRALKVR